MRPEKHVSEKLGTPLPAPLFILYKLSIYRDILGGITNNLNLGLV